MSLFDSTSMEGLAPIDHAKKAIRYALERIRDNPQIGYHMGPGTEAFALLTEAAASLFGEKVDGVRTYFAPKPTQEKLHTEAFREIEILVHDYRVIEKHYGSSKGAADELVEKIEELLGCGRKEREAA